MSSEAPWVLTIFMGKLEIHGGKSNSSCQFVWKVSENMGYDFRGFNFSTLFIVYLTDLNIHCSGSVLPPDIKFRIVLCIYYMFMHYKISTRVVCVNGKHPRSEILSTPQLPPPNTPPVPAVFSLIILRCFNSAHYILTKSIRNLIKISLFVVRCDLLFVWLFEDLSRPLTIVIRIS